MATERPLPALLLAAPRQAPRLHNRALATPSPDLVVAMIASPNLPPNRADDFAKDGAVTSGTISGQRTDTKTLLSLHDGSGREVAVSRLELQQILHTPRLGDRFKFRLAIDSKSGTLSASSIVWLAPGEPPPP